MSHCAPEATLKPKRFEFTPKTVISNVFVTQVCWEALWVVPWMCNFLCCISVLNTKRENWKLSAYYFICTTHYWHWGYCCNHILQEAQLLLRNSRSYTSHHRHNSKTLSSANDLHNSHQRRPKQNDQVINKVNFEILGWRVWGDSTGSL